MKPQLLLVLAMLLAGNLCLQSCKQQEKCEDGYANAKLTDGTIICIPEEIAKAPTKEMPVGSLYFHEKLGIIELTRHGWKNFRGQTVFNDLEDEK